VGRNPATHEWTVERVEGGVRLGGRLRSREGPDLVATVRRETEGLAQPIVDVSGVDQVDAGVVALLRAEFFTRHAPARLRGGDRFAALLDLYRDLIPCPPRVAPEPESLVAHVGRAAILEAGHATSIVAFTGEMAIAAGRVVRRPRTVQWGEIPYLVQRAGADAIPIVGLINFLIGFVLAYMAARALAMFGANIYVAELVGIGVTRQLAPLMTAIIVCGRSGAAYTTELGSMKVDQEIDALRTLGLEPYGWLVIPRLIALVLVLPVLTLVADVLGILGGMLVAVTSLDITPRGYLNELRATLVPWDVGSGLVLSLAFALALGLIACEQGFAASGGPQGVGRRTTSAVVTSLFAIVMLDACITVLFRAYGLT
jgi:phospholipid/cholesterol/gamma-HCH transport system permease protein